MTDDCRLAAAQTIEVHLVGATITVRAVGIALDHGEAALIRLVEEGPTTRCQVLACKADEPELAETTTVEAVFALPFAPHTVLVEHATGQKEFHFDVAVAAPAAEPPMRGDMEVVHGPVIIPAPAPAPAPAASAPSDAVLDAGGDFEWGGGPLPDATTSPVRGRIEFEPPPAPARAGGGGILRNWGDRLGGLWARRGATHAEPERVRDTMGAEPEMTGATHAEPEMATAALEVDAEPPPAEKGGYYPRLDAPAFAVVGTPTDVTVGVSPTEDPEVGGGLMRPPPTVGDTYIMSVQLMADGFSLADGTTSWVRDLAVTPNQPYPAIGMKIVADPIDVQAKAAVLQVVYTVEGQVIGNAKRALAVVTEEAAVAEVDLPDVAVGRAMALPLGATPPDLTVVILTDESSAAGRLLWAFRTPHPVTTPEVDCITDIGRTPADFAEALRHDAEKAEGKEMLLQTMRGIGRTIADVVHEEFWRIFKEVSDAAGGRPTVLFLSEEPYVPWELAVLRKPIFPDDARFLAAEAVTGRWLLDAGPSMPPPELVEMKAMAVVYGEYATARLRKLAEAKAEMERLKADYAATPVRATLAAVKSVLDGAPDAQVLHFAIHGKFNSRGADLLMEDGKELTAFAVRGSQLANAPFVFLNACQVGSANELLGSYAGMAQAFLRAGASAVVAPLWSVRDDIAKEISLRFYAGAFSGVAPAEILRQERASFGSGGPPTSATYLAYQFYGHPAFRLTR